MPVPRRLCSVLLVALPALLPLAPPASAAPPAAAPPSATSATSAAVDDYPYRTDSTGRADRWGFSQRQCVSFVAWRLEQRSHRLDNRTQRWGSALTWDDTARRLGYGIGPRPVVGAVAHWDADERSSAYARGSATANATITAGEPGHVGYVRAVYADGSVSVEHYNLGGDRRYTVSRLRAPRYLYVGVRAPARPGAPARRAPGAQVHPDE